MFPSSVNKSNIKNVLSSFNSALSENSENIENDYDVDENENSEFYNYINSDDNISESYTPKMYRNKTFYKYKALDFLIKEDPVVDNNSNVFICAFHVNQTGKLPFLQFILNKLPNSMFGDFLAFPCFSYQGTENILDECISKLDEVMDSYEKKQEYKYTGHISLGKDVYIFYDLSHFDFQVQELYRSDKMWLVLMDEIINYQKVCNFEIHKNVFNFFRNNGKFSLLFDENEEEIETPIVCYNGTCISKVKFTAIFGVGKSENDGIVGPYYYFTTYERSIEKGGWCNKETGAIVRFALFLGKCKVLLNQPADDIDDSLYKLEILKDFDNLTERQTMRVSDHDGKWVLSHQSVYIGKLELDDGRIIENAPMWVTKDYDQQTALSFHHIDNRTLGDSWNENKNYYIK